MKVDIYIAEENHQPKKSERWLGYIVEAEGGKGMLEYAEPVEATSYKAMIIMIVKILDRFLRPAEITMHIDNGWIVGNLLRTKQADGCDRSVLEHWQESGWKTKRGVEVKNREEWQRLYNKLRVFEQSGGTFQFVYLEKDDRKRGRILSTINDKRQSFE